MSMPFMCDLCKETAALIEISVVSSRRQDKVMGSLSHQGGVEKNKVDLGCPADPA